MNSYLAGHLCQILCQVCVGGLEEPNAFSTLR